MNGPPYQILGALGGICYSIVLLCWTWRLFQPCRHQPPCKSLHAACLRPAASLQLWNSNGFLHFKQMATFLHESRVDQTDTPEIPAVAGKKNNFSKHVNIYGSCLSRPERQTAENVGLQVNVCLSGFCGRGLKACRMWGDFKKKKMCSTVWKECLCCGDCINCLGDDSRQQSSWWVIYFHFSSQQRRQTEGQNAA